MSTAADEQGGVPRARRHPLWGVLRIAAGIVLLVVLFRLVPLADVAEQLRKLDPRPLAVAVCVSLAAMFTAGLKLWLLVRAAVPGVPLLRMMRSHYIGTFFNNFLPTGFGGDLVKVADIRSAGVPLSRATAAVVVERATGLGFVCALGGAVALGWPAFLGEMGLSPLRWPLACVGVLSIAGPLIALVAWRSVAGRVDAARERSRVACTLWRVEESFRAFRSRPWTVAGAIGLSAVVYLGQAISTILVVRAAGGSIGLAEAVGIIPVIKVPELLPISLGGLGLREGATTYCLSRLDLTPVAAAAVALTQRFFIWMHSALGGCWYAAGGGPRLSDARTGGADDES